MKWRQFATLAEMLQHFHTLTDALFYEVLDLPLPHLEQLKTLKARRPLALSGKHWRALLWPRVAFLWPWACCGWQAS